jgi:hypothetical protein
MLIISRLQIDRKKPPLPFKVQKIPPTISLCSIKFPGGYLNFIWNSDLNMHILSLDYKSPVAASPFLCGCLFVLVPIAVKEEPQQVVDYMSMSPNKLRCVSITLYRILARIAFADLNPSRSVQAIACF